jgi:flagellar hook-associated protein 3 FlgL
MIDTSTNMLYHIGNLNTQNEKISRQMATGKAIDKGSENSLLHGDLINLEDKLRVTMGLQLQVVKTKAINDVADSNLTDIKSALDKIKVDLLKGLNDGMDRSDKLALATNLKGIRDNLYDRMNARVDGEYVYTGSETTKQTLVKDSNFESNGQIEFNGDGFLRKIAVQPGSYRDRGVTAYDTAFYNTDSARAGEVIVFKAGDRIIDENGHEWKANEAGDKIQQYDHNGLLYDPPIEINLYRTNEPKVQVDLGIGTNADATGNFTINVDGNAFTAAGADAATVFAALKAQIEAHPNGYTVSSSLENNDTFYINSPDTTPIVVTGSDTDASYDMSISNQIEATGSAQSREATWTFTVPTTPEGREFEAKHNYFDDLNKIINALEGYSTKLDGTKGPSIPDGAVRTILEDGLDQTSKQFDATNIGHGELGGRNAIFNTGYDKLTAQVTHYNILIQEYGAADMAKLAMESKALELTYQSLYTTISKMNNLSLVNFLK